VTAAVQPERADVPTARRRAQVATAVEELGLGALLVSRPSNIRYLTGFTGSAGYLLMRAGDAPQLFVDVRYRDQAVEQAADVDVVGDAAPPQLWSVVVELLAGAGGRCGVEATHLLAGQFVELQEHGVDAVLAQDVVERARAVKDEHELALLRRAGAIADGVLEHLAAWLRPGVSEREVAGEIELRQRQLGASGSATELIVASGPRSALPHGRATERMLRAGEPVMIDMSPTVEGYRGDVTRTFHLGPPSDEFRRIYDLVADAQRRAEQALRPGAVASDVDGVARSLIADAGHGTHFEHSLGHGVGLGVHEAPLLSPHDASILEAGAVVTVEPGVYVPGVAGVRIENSVAVRPDGPEPLNRFTTELIAIPIA
jgi:Xaa-Pro aminopeptidase